MNKVVISGRLGQDPELKYAQSGTPVLRFSLALDRGKDKDGNDKGTDWPRCVAFGRTAEIINRYSGKGKRLLVEGRLQTGDYTSQAGEKHYTTDVIADRVEIIDWPERGTVSAPAANTGQPAACAAGANGYQRSQPDNRPPAAPAEQQMGMNDVPAGFEYVADDVPF